MGKNIWRTADIHCQVSNETSGNSSTILHTGPEICLKIRPALPLTPWIHPFSLLERPTPELLFHSFRFSIFPGVQNTWTHVLFWKGTATKHSRGGGAHYRPKNIAIGFIVTTHVALHSTNHKCEQHSTGQERLFHMRKFQDMDQMQSSSPSASTCHPYLYKWRLSSKSSWPHFPLMSSITWFLRNFFSSCTVCLRVTSGPKFWLHLNSSCSQSTASAAVKQRS